MLGTIAISVVILAIILAIIISSLPLYLAVKFLGGDATIVKVFLTNILVAVLSSALTYFFGLSTLYLLIIIVILYMFIFDLGIIRAFVVWFLQYVIAVLLFIAFIAMLGASVFL
jgi:hypothetical protein